MKCKYPNCKKKSTHTWALVDLCEEHYETIKTETETFYQPNSLGKSGRPPNKDELINRPHYLQISHLIPWSKEKLGQLKGVHSK